MFYRERVRENRHRLILTIGVLLAWGVLVLSALPAFAENITVPADVSHWQDTGIDIQIGQILTVNAWGTSYYSWQDDSWTIATRKSNVMAGGAE